MMKKNIILAALVSLTLSSCYEDKSSFPDNKIDDVVLNVTEADKTIRTGYLEQLDIVPELTKGGKALGDEGFSYLWELNILPNNGEFEVIGTERELHAVMTNPIATRNYLLKLTVHDDAEELSYLFTWDVYIETAFLDGLIVSDTRDGQTSDLTLILNKQLTMNYNKNEVIHRNIVTTATGQPYQSLLTSLNPFLYSSINGTHSNFLFAVDSNKHLVRFNCMDFSVTNGKDLCYYYDGETVRGLFAMGANVVSCDHYLITTKGVYYGSLNNQDFLTSLNATLSTSAPMDDVYAIRNYNPSDEWWYGECAGAWIDDVYGNVVIFDAGFQGGSYQDLQEGENDAYSVGDLHLQQVLAAEMTGGSATPTFLVKNAEDNYQILTVGSVTETYYDEEWDYYWDETYYCPGKCMNIPSLDMAGRISRAVSTKFTDENSVLYIATPTEVSAALYGAGKVTDAGTKFTPDAGETITSMKVYHQGDYYYSLGLLMPENLDAYGRPRLDLTSRALIVTTEKGDEGFVYVVPMTQLGTGNLDRAAALKYSGFGHILDVATTGY